MKRSSVVVMLSILAVMLGLAGCSGAVVALPTPSSVAVSPLAVDDSPLPTPVAPAVQPAGQTPVVTPTPDPSLGSIAGTILMEGHPVGFLPAALYLGDPTGSSTIGAYVALDIATAIQGYVAADGSFLFPNVPPGTYSIVVWTPAGAYIVQDQATGVARLIEVKDNARIDVGHIDVPAMGD